MQKSLCDDDAEDTWDQGYDACKAQHPDEYSDEFSACMDLVDADHEDRLKDCKNQYDDCIGNLPKPASVTPQAP